MRAAGQHVDSRGSALSARISALAIPWKRVALYITLAAGFFILGFVPMWMKASHAGEQRDVAQREVRLAQLRNTLSAAVINVQRDQYEPARQLSSDFFTSLRTQIDHNDQDVFTVSQQESLRRLIAGRDQVITSLARAEPTSKDRLFELYETYNKLTVTGVH